MRKPSGTSPTPIFISTAAFEKYLLTAVELRGFEPLTSCMPYKFRLRQNMAICGSTRSFDRLILLPMAGYRRSLAPHLAPCRGDFGRVIQAFVAARAAPTFLRHRLLVEGWVAFHWSVWACGEACQVLHPM